MCLQHVKKMILSVELVSAFLFNRGVMEYSTARITATRTPVPISVCIFVHFYSWILIYVAQIIFFFCLICIVVEKLFVTPLSVYFNSVFLLLLYYDLSDVVSFS